MNMSTRSECNLEYSGDRMGNNRAVIKKAKREEKKVKKKRRMRSGLFECIHNWKEPY